MRGRKKCYNNKYKVIVLRLYDDDLAFMEQLAQQNSTTIQKLILQFVKEKNGNHNN